MQVPDRPQKRHTLYYGARRTEHKYFARLTYLLRFRGILWWRWAQAKPNKLRLLQTECRQANSIGGRDPQRQRRLVEPEAPRPRPDSRYRVPRCNVQPMLHETPKHKALRFMRNRLKFDLRSNIWNRNARIADRHNPRRSAAVHNFPTREKYSHLHHEKDFSCPLARQD